MVGLHILKHRFNLSDEAVVQGLHENLYWMEFCGVKVAPRYEGKEQVPPRFLEASSMSKFRKRIGAEGMRIVEEVIREGLISQKQICPRKQFTDTTAMEKDIAYPTDTGLLQKGRELLLRTIRKIKGQGVRIPERLRSFSRLSKKVVVEINKFGKGKKERLEQGIKDLMGYARQVVSKVPEVINNCQQKLAQWGGQGYPKALERLTRSLEQQVELVQRVIYQTRERLRGHHIQDKIYRLYERLVACIGKGKRRKPGEEAWPQGEEASRKASQRVGGR